MHSPITCIKKLSVDRSIYPLVLFCQGTTSYVTVIVMDKRYFIRVRFTLRLLFVSCGITEVWEFIGLN